MLVCHTNGLANTFELAETPDHDHADVTLVGLNDFSATSVEVTPITIAGCEWFERHFGDGAVSANVPKSESGRLVDSIQAELLNFEARSYPE